MISWLISALRQPRRRLRWWYLGAVALTIVAGLVSRRFPGLLPPLLGKYPGDALWALMAFFGWGVVLRKASSLRIAALALATAGAIELLKLWQSPWWDEVRRSTVGHLIFGQAFSWKNLLAYAIGVVCGLMIEIVFVAKQPAS